MLTYSEECFFYIVFSVDFVEIYPFLEYRVRVFGKLGVI